MIYCLIPAKSYAQSKSRLAPVLSLEQRTALSRWLLRRTLRLTRVVLEQVVVISRDRALLNDAEAWGAQGLLETSPGLNPALTQAARFAQAHGADGLLILPADLPRLTTTDLETILVLGAPPTTLGAGSSTLVIAPCRHEMGTNALLVRPPDLIPFRFGPDSFAAHCAAARAAGAAPIVYRADSIAFDLDTPEDWRSGIGGWGLRVGDPSSGICDL